MFQFRVFAVLALAILCVGASPSAEDFGADDDFDFFGLQSRKFRASYAEPLTASKTPEDMIKFLKGLRKDEMTKVLVPVAVALMKQPMVESQLAKMMEKSPEAVAAVEAVLAFLNGPEAESLMAVIHPAFKAMVEAGKAFYVKIQEPMGELIDAMTKEGTMVYLMAQKKENIAVLEKLLDLPELKIIDAELMERIKGYVSHIKKNSIFP